MNIGEEYIVEGYYPTIGIECHVQLKTKTKLFASESNDAKDASPNTLVSHITFGMPGALPVLNESAISLASKAAFALGTRPQKFSKFDRKHYFYPDLPKGYQITQFDEPIVVGGSVQIVLEDGTNKVINITRAHIEEDAGKSAHPSGVDYSLVDLNRAGTPLLEIVSEPEIHSSAEAKAFAKELWLRMKYADVSEANLYHGNMRFDVNVSISKDPNTLGTRSEIKNLNSFKSVERAVDYEIDRQLKLLKKGETVVQETRGWIDDKQITVSQRSKEDAHDYRYFPDPDIPPISLSDEYINNIESQIPIMPDVWRKKLGNLGIDKMQIETLLISQAEYSTDFLSLIAESNEKDANMYANWITNIEVPLRRNSDNESTIDMSNTKRKALFEAVRGLYNDKKISSNSAKSIIENLMTKDLPEDMEKFAEEKGYIQVSDEGELKTVVQKVLDSNPKAVEEIKAGESKVVGFLVGQVMKESNGKANPALAQKIIKMLIEE